MSPQRARSSSFFAPDPGAPTGADVLAEVQRRDLHAAMAGDHIELTGGDVPPALARLVKSVELELLRLLKHQACGLCGSYRRVLRAGRVICPECLTAGRIA